MSGSRRHSALLVLVVSDALHVKGHFSDVSMLFQLMTSKLCARQAGHVRNLSGPESPMRFTTAAPWTVPLSVGLILSSAVSGAGSLRQRCHLGLHPRQAAMHGQRMAAPA